MSESDREESANIEEVMASIRKAIEEEAGEEAEGQAHSPLEPHVRAPQEGRTDADSGVIHLTRMVTSDGEVGRACRTAARSRP